MTKMIWLYLFVLILLTSCTSIPHPIIHQIKASDDVTTLSYTADIRGTHIIKKGDNTWICKEPEPDAAFSYDDEENLSISLVNTGEKGGEGYGSGSEDSALSGRVSYLLLSRELNYRLCEMAANTNATFDQYLEAHKANLEVIKEIAMIEAKNITHATTVSISSGTTSALNFSETQSGTEASPVNTKAEPTSEKGFQKGSDDNTGDADNDDPDTGDADNSDGD